MLKELSRFHCAGDAASALWGGSLGDTVLVFTPFLDMVFLLSTDMMPALAPHTTLPMHQDGKAPKS